MQRPASPQKLPIKEAEGAQILNEQTSDHCGEISALKLTQALVEGDDTETIWPTKGGDPTKEAQQLKGSPACATDPSGAKGGNLAFLPACLLDQPGGGSEDMGQRKVDGKLSLSRDRQVSTEGNVDANPATELVEDAVPGGESEDMGQGKVDGKLSLSRDRQVSTEGNVDANPAKEIAEDPVPMASVQAFTVPENRSHPEAVGSDASEEHDTHKDNSTPDAMVEGIDKPRQPRHVNSTRVEGLDKACQPCHVSSISVDDVEKASQPRHVSPFAEGISQGETTRKRAREIVDGKSEQQCDHERETRKEESARVIGQNGKYRRRQSLVASRCKIDGGSYRVGTGRGRKMADTREYDYTIIMREGVKSDEISTVTWYRTIVACLTAESRE